MRVVAGRDVVAPRGPRGAKVLVLCLAVLAPLTLAAPASAFEVLDEIGEPGVGAGGVATVQGISVDGNGTLSVAQTGIARISQFDRNGDFVHAFGRDVIPGGGTGFEVCTAATTCQAGSANEEAGDLTSPWGVTSTPDGASIYVSETGNARASQFSAPAFTRAWGYAVIPGGGDGFEVCTAATTCQAGMGSPSVGAMISPLGIALGPDGRVNVGEPTSRIHTYGADGAFVGDHGSVAGGTGPGLLTTPYDLALDAAGAFAIADTGNHRISVYRPSGDFAYAFGHDVVPGGDTGLEVCTVETDCKAGASGGAAGQLEGVAGIDFAPDGSIYVSELVNSRVSQFTIEGDFIRAFGYDVIPGGGTGFEICTTQTTCQAGAAGNGPGQFNQPFGVATDCRGSIYVADPGVQRIQKFGDDPRLAPCPSNDITIGKPDRNKRKGTAKLPVEVPGPGELTLAGKNLRPAVQNPTVAGEALLPVKATGKAKRKLKKRGKAKVKALVGYTPVNGDPNLEESAFKLKRKTKRGKRS